MSCLIFWTCAQLEEARTICGQLVDQRLVACATIIPRVESVYRWQGSVEHAEETKVILKTTQGHFEAVKQWICEKGSYAVPEILQIDVQQGNPAYLQWLVDETR